jgi:hypothetical protein
VSGKDPIQSIVKEVEKWEEYSFSIYDFSVFYIPSNMHLETFEYEPHEEMERQY